MTVELSAVAPEDVEELVIAWLTPLRRTAMTRHSGDPLPFTLVTHIAGHECEEEGTADLIVSVHTLCDKALGEDAAAAQCKLTHRRMLRLAQCIDPITLSDARLVGVDYVDVTESPRWQFYSDQILQKVGRYQIGLSYVAVS